jgi:hypothetical protein
MLISSSMLELGISSSTATLFIAKTVVAKNMLSMNNDFTWHLFMELPDLKGLCIKSILKNEYSKLYLSTTLKLM